MQGAYAAGAYAAAKKKKKFCAKQSKNQGDIFLRLYCELVFKKNIKIKLFAKLLFRLLRRRGFRFIPASKTPRVFAIEKF